MASTSITRSISSTSAIKKFTLSMWVKRSGLGSYQRIFCSDGGTGDTYFRFQNNDAIEWSGHTSDATAGGLLTTSRLFRDTNAWYHFVIKVDTTQSTASDRLKFWVNGVLETAFSAETMPNQDVTDNIVNTSKTHRISGTSSAQYLDGSIAHFHFTQGYAYDASTFGEFDSTSGIWVPKTAPSVTYGTNGFFLKFENSGNLDLDSSGNGLTFATSGTLTQNVDTPTNVFPTFNPLAPSSAAQTMQNGNLYLPGPNSNNYWQSVPATMGCTSGKWYWEFKDETDWGSTSDSTRRYGICDLDTIRHTLSSGADVRFSDTTSAYAYMNASGVRHSGSTISGTTSTHPTFAEGDFLMFAMDLDNNKLYFGKNGTWNDSGDPTSGSTGTGSVADISSTAVWSPYAEIKYGSDTVSANFGQGYFRTTSAGSNTDANGHGKFKYSVPSGYYAICTKNIKEFG